MTARYLSGRVAFPEFEARKGTWIDCADEQNPFVAHVTSRKAPARNGEHQGRAEVVIGWLAS
jgi:hypothetical protein